MEAELPATQPNIDQPGTEPGEPTPATDPKQVAGSLSSKQKAPFYEAVSRKASKQKPHQSNKRNKR